MGAGRQKRPGAIDAAAAFVRRAGAPGFNR